MGLGLGFPKWWWSSPCSSDSSRANWRSEASLVRVRVRARVRARARVDALILHQARNPNPKLTPEPNQAEFDVAKRRRG